MTKASSLLAEIVNSSLRNSREKRPLYHVADVEPEDVLCGRGPNINSHVGNLTFRMYVAEKKEEYNQLTSTVEKTLTAAAVVQAVREQNGRFLELDEKTQLWNDIGYRRAHKKASQALREGVRQRKSGGACKEAETSQVLKSHDHAESETNPTETEELSHTTQQHERGGYTMALEKVEEEVEQSKLLPLPLLQENLQDPNSKRQFSQECSRILDRFFNGDDQVDQKGTSACSVSENSLMAGSVETFDPLMAFQEEDGDARSTLSKFSWMSIGTSIGTNSLFSSGKGTSNGDTQQTTCSGMDGDGSTMDAESVFSKEYSCGSTALSVGE